MSPPMFRDGMYDRVVNRLARELRGRVGTTGEWLPVGFSSSAHILRHFRAMSDDDLMKIRGIGPQSVVLIRDQTWADDEVNHP